MTVMYKGGLHERAIICNGVSKVFDSSGRLISENGGLGCKYLDGAVKVSVLSLLQIGVSEVEIGIESDTFKKYTQDKSFVEILNLLVHSKGFIAMFKRPGRQGTTPYTQILFVYPYGTQILDNLVKLGINAMEV